MEQIRHELERRDLNKMLPGTITTAAGVANWIWDRLVMDHALTEVVVESDGTRARIAKE